MNELSKHLYIPKGVIIHEPMVMNGSMHFAVKEPIHEPSMSLEMQVAKEQFGKDMEEVAPDLKSYDLAKKYADSLFNKLIKGGVVTQEELLQAGSQEFHNIGKYVLGPLAVSFVDSVLKKCHGKAIFPARDATPFFYIAKTLKTLTPEKYPVALDDIQNPVFNRKMWGIDDEQDVDSEVLSITYPLVQKMLLQMGFFSDQQKAFIEVGCWGSMIDKLNETMEKGQMPKEEFSVYFLYTHLPDHIYGFTNLRGNGIPEKVLETIADTWEAFPKFFRRPNKLVEENGLVKASLDGKMIDSPFLASWSLAGLQGMVDAAADFATQEQVINPQDELLKLWRLSLKSQSGEFTGILPTHTETWSEGEAWKKNWKWGKIPPLK